MLLVPWRVQIAKADRIKGMDKVEWWHESGELPGILNWAVRGLHRLRAQKGFSDSEIMDKALENYRAETNPARQFLLEICSESTLDETILSKDLYGAYCRWCKENGHNYPLSEKQFGKEIKRSYPKMKRDRQTTGTREWYYRGIRLNDF
jgi:phage/plasmid-associated DNA primase